MTVSSGRGFTFHLTKGLALIRLVSAVAARLGSSLDFQREEQVESYTVTGYGIHKGQIASDEHWAAVFQTAYVDFLTNLDKILDEAGH